MSDLTLFGLAALIIGASIAIQASTNTLLLKHVGNIIWVAIAIFSVGLIYLLFLAAVFKSPPPELYHLNSAPLWAYSGGVIVAIYVVAITYMAPKLGVGNAIIFIVLGQVITSVVIDHLGLFGLPATAVSLQRLLGCMLLMGGVVLAKS